MQHINAWNYYITNLSNKNNYEKHILGYSAMSAKDITHREVKEYFVTSTNLSNRLLKIPKLFYRLLKYLNVRQATWQGHCHDSCHHAEYSVWNTSYTKGAILSLLINT